MRALLNCNTYMNHPGSCKRAEADAVSLRGAEILCVSQVPGEAAAAGPQAILCVQGPTLHNLSKVSFKTWPFFELRRL